MSAALVASDVEPVVIHTFFTPRALVDVLRRLDVLDTLVGAALSAGDWGRRVAPYTA